MISRTDFKEAFSAALPIMLGYVAIGIPCGILSDSIGLNVVQVLLLSYIFYSGAGQFMIPNLFLAGSPIASIILSVSFVNTRQMLYSASLAPYAASTSRPLSFLFAATVTDESYGVSIDRFRSGGWSVPKATIVNLLSQSTWAWSNALGVVVGSMLGIPLAIASFAMTSIFICLMITQKLSAENVTAMVAAMVGVYVCKLVGLTGPAILIGAAFGVVCAMAAYKLHGARHDKDSSLIVALKARRRKRDSIGKPDATLSRQEGSHATVERPQQASVQASMQDSGCAVDATPTREVRE